MAGAITIQNNAHLERLLMTDPTMEQYMRTAVGFVLEQARRDVVSEVRAVLENDPREAYRAVRRTLYKRVLGGQVNILAKRRAGKMGTAPGSSRGRLARTEQLMSYQGSDRGFILRFINAGTRERVAKHMNAHAIKRTGKVSWHTYKSGQVGGRGSIAGRNFFGPASTAAISEAAQLLQIEFNKIVQQQMQ